MNQPFILNMNADTLQRLYDNKNLVIVLAYRDSNLFKPTHYMLVSDYPDSSIMLREGFKEALKPYDLSDYPVAEAYYKARDMQQQVDI